MEMEPAPVVEGQEAPASPEAEGQANSWYDNASDDVKGFIQNKGWDDPVKAVTSYQQLEKFHGVAPDQLIKLPKDMQADGAMDEVFQKLGRPDEPDKYDFTLPDGADQFLDKDKLDDYKKLSHKLGLSNKQFSELMQHDLDNTYKTNEALNEAKKQEQEADYQNLLKEWGGQAAEREELSRRGLRALLPSGVDQNELISKIEDSIGTAMTLKLFANAGDKLSREDKIHESSGDRPYGYTKEQAVSDKNALMSELKVDPTRLSNYNKGMGPDYDKMQRLNKLVAGQ